MEVNDNSRIEAARLLPSLAIMASLPSAQRIFEFAVKMVAELPGVTGAALCCLRPYQVFGDDGLIKDNLDVQTSQRSMVSDCGSIREERWIISDDETTYGFLIVTLNVPSDLSDILPSLATIIALNLGRFHFQQKNAALGLVQKQLERRNTELQDVQQALKAVTRRHELALHASGIGIWDWDIGKDELVWDQQMYSLYGISSDKFLNVYDAWKNGIHSADVQEAQNSVQRALCSQEPFNTEFRVVWPSGEIRYIRAIAEVLRDDDGKPIRMIGVNWDVTDEKRRLKDLELANQELGKFAYVAAHDLQAPLRHVRSFVGLLDEKLIDLDEESRDWFSRIVESTERMQLLIQDLLSYARIGRTTKDPTYMNLKSVVLDVVDQVVEDKDRNQCSELTIDVGDLPDYLGHENHLRSLIQNLVENAIRYAKTDTPLVLSVFSKDYADSLVLYFRDNGIGIEPKYKEKIFGIFQTLNVKKKGSTGIGLAICKKVAELHGGSITVESELGIGSTFVVELRKSQIKQLEVAKTQSAGYVQAVHGYNA